jgi:hypothetical protein
MKQITVSDNDCYDSFRNDTLIITHVAYNTEDHPGYDTSVSPQALCDFKTTKGKEVNCSLYEYEFELI